MEKQLTNGRNIRFAPLTQDLLQATDEFNKRLQRAGVASSFRCFTNRDRDGERPAPMEVERYVAVDADGQVRGGYLLRWQSLWLRSEQLQGAALGLPISEGIIDQRYAMVGVSVLRDAAKRCENLYACGGGGRDGPVFRVVQHAGWQIQDIPFLFRVIKGKNFLLKLPQMQRPVRRLAATIGGSTGLSQLATGLLHAGSAVRHSGSSSLRMASDVSVEEVPSLAGAAEEVWSRVKSQYAFCVVRDDAHVDPAFPPARKDLHRLVVRRGRAIIGWCVVMTQSLSRLKAFLGDVVPGLIVDTFGDTQESTEIARAATAFLADQGVDIVLTNTSHDCWLSAFMRTGFLSWQSQFPVLVSKSLARRIGDLPGTMLQTHMTRGDGDGVHYLH